MTKNHPKSQSFFDSEHLSKRIKERTVRGGVLTLFAQISKFILQIGSTVILARLLTPGDYGLIGMVTVMLNFVALFKDIGLSQATIQKSEINQAQVSNLFWVNVVISFVVSALIFLLAPLLVWFYQEPRLLLITRVLAIGFFVSGLSLQHLALLKRQMLFGKIILVEVTSQIFAVVIGIITALSGLGYWSLVLMQVTIPFVTTTGICFNCRWIPSLPNRNTSIKDMLNYGWNLTGFNLLNFFSRNLDNVLIGKYWGTQALGLYANAYKLLLFPIQQINAPISNVALPALSRLQSEPERYSKFYYKMILLITTIGMPIVGFFFADADKLTLLLLGEKWLDTVPLFRALSPSALLGTFNIATGLVYASLGRTDRQFRWGLFASTLQIILFFIAIPWGTLAIAWSFSLHSLLLFLPKFIYCYSGTHLKLTTTLRTITYPLIAAILAIIIIFLLNNITSLNAIIDSLVYAISYLACWFLLPNGYTKFKLLWQL